LRTILTQRKTYPPLTEDPHVRRGPPKRARRNWQGRQKSVLEIVSADSMILLSPQAPLTRPRTRGRPATVNHAPSRSLSFPPALTRPLVLPRSPQARAPPSPGRHFPCPRSHRLWLLPPRDAMVSPDLSACSRGGAPLTRDGRVGGVPLRRVGPGGGAPAPARTRLPSTPPPRSVSISTRGLQGWSPLFPSPFI
jgi:hypothetical protein